MSRHNSLNGGIYVAPDQFVRFAESPSLDGQIATRQAALGGFGQWTMYLPNPDPILRRLGQSIQVYRDLRTDPAIGGALRRRKAAVLAMERGLDRGAAKSRLAANVEAILRDLPLDRILSEILDAPFYGYQPVEIVWKQSGSYIVPGDVLGKPPEWFGFGPENELLFRSLGAPMGEPVPPRKFLLPRQDPSYDNPYGFADASMVFWPKSFKAGGLGMFVKACEKFGMPIPVGKHPRNAPAEDIEDQLDMLERLIQDGVASIADDESIVLVESGKANPAEMYTELLKWCRSEINIALMGQNQSTEADSTHASAKAGGDVAKDIRDAHAGIASEALSQLVRWIVDLNWHESDAAPVYGIWEQEEVDEVLAKRDKVLTEAGAKFTRKYWMRTYNLQEEDLAPDPLPPSAPNQPSIANFAGVDTAEFPGQAALEDALAQLAASGELQQQAEQLLKPVLDAVAGATSEEEVLAALAETYPDMQPDGLIETLTRLLFVADVVGRLEAQAELAAD